MYKSWCQKSSRFIPFCARKWQGKTHLGTCDDKKPKQSWEKCCTRPQGAPTRTLGADLVFVTNIINYICGEKLSCGEISAFYTEFEQFMEFYQSLCRFCSKSMWRKICVEKKWQMWGLILNGALEPDQKAYDENFVINMLIFTLFHNMLPSLIISDNLLTSLWGKP